MAYCSSIVSWPLLLLCAFPGVLKSISYLSAPLQKHLLLYPHFRFRLDHEADTTGFVTGRTMMIELLSFNMRFDM